MVIKTNWQRSKDIFVILDTSHIYASSNVTDGKILSQSTRVHSGKMDSGEGRPPLLWACPPFYL